MFQTEQKSNPKEKQLASLMFSYFIRHSKAVISMYQKNPKTPWTVTEFLGIAHIVVFCI